MMRHAWFAASLLSLTGWISAQGPFTPADVPISKTATERAQRFRAVIYDKKRVYKNVRTLTKELVWHKDLAQARTAAAKSGKPIVLIQALGDLTGYV
jgi:hypothetical protein